MSFAMPLARAYAAISAGPAQPGSCRPLFMIGSRIVTSNPGTAVTQNSVVFQPGLFMAYADVVKVYSPVVPA